MWAQDSDRSSPGLLHSRQVLKLGLVRQVPEKTTLLRSGRKDFSLGIIEKGVVEIRSHPMIGHNRVVQLLGPGEILSESLIEGWSTNAETATEVIIRCLDKPMLVRLTEQSPLLAGRLEEELALQVQLAQAIKLAMSRQPPAARLARFLLRLLERPLEPKSNVVSLRGNPVVNIPIPKEDVASYLGLSQGKLNQATQTLQQAGIIRTLTAHQFEILNLRGLGSLLSP